jgi:hypothetical protein
MLHNLHCASNTDIAASSRRMRIEWEPNESTSEAKFYNV